jgi:hypothetical protein
VAAIFFAICLVGLSTFDFDPAKEHFGFIFEKSGALVVSIAY